MSYARGSESTGSTPTHSPSRPRRSSLRSDAVDAGVGIAALDRQYGKRSLVVTSNWAFEQWTNFLPDATTATAILDRLLQRCQVAVLSGESDRLREAKEVARTQS